MDHSHGKAIDSATRIFRFNTAPRGGEKSESGVEDWEHLIDYTDMVGQRDDVRVVNDLFPYTYLGGWRPYEEPATYLMMPLEWPTPRIPPEVEQLANLSGAAVYSVSPLFVQRAVEAMHEIFAPEWWSELGQSQNDVNELGSPTSGLLASLLAFKLCKEVRLYGAAVTPRGLHAQYHYYSSDQNSWVANANGMNSHQDCKAEKFLFRVLATNPDLDQTDVAEVQGIHRIRKECKFAYRWKNASDGATSFPRLPIPIDAWRREFER